jgi:hypothetical protein
MLSLYIVLKERDESNDVCVSRCKKKMTVESGNKQAR